MQRLHADNRDEGLHGVVGEHAAATAVAGTGLAGDPLFDGGYARAPTNALATASSAATGLLDALTALLDTRVSETNAIDARRIHLFRLRRPTARPMARCFER